MIDKTKLVEAIEEAMAETSEVFRQAQIEQIELEVWTWPRQTSRQNGSVVGSPRDIVDTGSLRDSLIVKKNNGLSYQYTYTVDYATNVHEGWINSNGVDMPPRPWVNRSIQLTDLKDEFQKSLRKNL